MNIVEPILRHGRMQPGMIALVDDGQTVTYGALADLVLRTTGHLHTLGVRRGDYVGLCLKDNWQHVVALLAVARLGATSVQIDPRSRPVEKARIAAAFDFKLIVAAPEAEANAGCATVPLDFAWERRVAQTEAPAALPDEWHDPMVVQSTSGTTGLPKFSLATHAQFYFRLASLCEYLPAIRPHRYLATMPLFSALGRNVCLLHLLHGSTIILYPSIFTAVEFVEVAAKNCATVAAVAPSSIRQLLVAAGCDDPLLPTLALLISGGAPLFPDEKREALRKLTPNFHEMYGVSALGPISVLRPKDIPAYADSTGRPFPLVNVEIVDEGDRPVGFGETGRLRCRGPALASPIADQDADDFRNGWHYPGEIAALDEAGYLHLQGRTSDVIFRGGAKVFPSEIEAVLQAHEKIADVAIVARAGASGEQELAAYVVTNAEVTPGQLLAHCRQRLTPYKVPEQIHIVAELPRNPAGKVDKRALAGQPSASARADV